MSVAESMKAAAIEQFGPPDVLRLAEANSPALAADQVLVEVEFAGVTFVETQIRAGRAPHAAMRPALPAVLGNIVGGRVVEIGASAPPTLLDKRVVGATGGRGGYAELAAVSAASAVEVPRELGMAEAVALAADGRTALALVRRLAPRRGQVALVTAAAGGLGSLLVQLLADLDVRVVAAAGGAAKLALARELGAELAVDYTRPGWGDRVCAEFGELDLVLDGVGGEHAATAFSLLRRGGVMSSYGAASGQAARFTEEQAAARGVLLLRGTGLEERDRGWTTARALAAATAGAFRPVIGQVRPLAQAAQAHAAIEAREVLGKTLLRVAAS